MLYLANKYTNEILVNLLVLFVLFIFHVKKKGWDLLVKSETIMNKKQRITIQYYIF